MEGEVEQDIIFSEDPAGNMEPGFQEPEVLPLSEEPEAQEQLPSPEHKELPQETPAQSEVSSVSIEGTYDAATGRITIQAQEFGLNSPDPITQALYENLQEKIVAGERGVLLQVEFQNVIGQYRAEEDGRFVIEVQHRPLKEVLPEVVQEEDDDAVGTDAEFLEAQPVLPLVELSYTSIGDSKDEVVPNFSAEKISTMIPRAEVEFRSTSIDLREAVSLVRPHLVKQGEALKRDSQEGCFTPLEQSNEIQEQELSVASVEEVESDSASEEFFEQPTQNFEVEPRTVIPEVIASDLRPVESTVFLPEISRSETISRAPKIAESAPSFSEGLPEAPCNGREILEPLHFELPEGTIQVVEIPPEAGIILVQEVEEQAEENVVSIIETRELAGEEIRAKDIDFRESLSLARSDLAVQGPTLEREPMPSVPQKEEVGIFEAAPTRVVDNKPVILTQTLSLQEITRRVTILPSTRDRVELVVTPPMVEHPEPREEVYEVAPRTNSEVEDKYTELLSMEVFADKVLEARDENNDKDRSEENREKEEPLSVMRGEDTQKEVSLARSDLAVQSPTLEREIRSNFVEARPDTVQEVKLTEVEPRTVEISERPPETIVKGEDIKPKEESRIITHNEPPLRIVRTEEISYHESRPAIRIEAMNVQQPTGFNPSRFMVVEEDKEAGIRLLRKAA